MLLETRLQEEGQGGLVARRPEDILTGHPDVVQVRVGQGQVPKAGGLGGCQLLPVRPEAEENAGEGPEGAGKDPGLGGHDRNSSCVSKA
jgi:hypothetical protein